ncbi:hypothetical protein B0H14DRAFT_3479194 [Mycena olivaceomarginata]|nr:hypothetical protein B0H14DRAFT_3479194 [Mycena olivaceomarginata]
MAAALALRTLRSAMPPPPQPYAAVVEVAPHRLPAPDTDSLAYVREGNGGNSREAPTVWLYPRHQLVPHTRRQLASDVFAVRLETVPCPVSHDAYDYQKMEHSSRTLRSGGDRRETTSYRPSRPPLYAVPPIRGPTSHLRLYLTMGPHDDPSPVAAAFVEVVHANSPAAPRACTRTPRAQDGGRTRTPQPAGCIGRPIRARYIQRAFRPARAGAARLLRPSKARSYSPTARTRSRELATHLPAHTPATSETTRRKVQIVANTSGTGAPSSAPGPQQARSVGLST